MRVSHTGFTLATENAYILVVSRLNIRSESVMSLMPDKKNIVSIIIVAVIILAMPLFRIIRRSPRLNEGSQAIPSFGSKPFPEDLQGLIDTYLSLSENSKREVIEFTEKLAREQSRDKTSKTIDGIPVINWSETHNYINEIVFVEGTVIRSHNTGKICFLNFHNDFRRTFSLVIFGSDFSKFPSQPEKYYLNKKVRVRGRITVYNDVPQIVLSEPGQVEILK